MKNIERVQGDERDSIILTVGYARGNDGQLRYSWGPVLQEGGHRRVNVAISRAKSEIVLVTSFAADEVDERASEREGFQLMRRFITFAATGGSDFGDAGAQPVELNPFEYDVLRRLTEAGLDVTPQYGVAATASTSPYGTRCNRDASCSPSRPTARRTTPVSSRANATGSGNRSSKAAVGGSCASGRPTTSATPTARSSAWWRPTTRR